MPCRPISRRVVICCFCWMMEVKLRPGQIWTTCLSSMESQLTTIALSALHFINTSTQRRHSLSKGSSITRYHVLHWTDLRRTGGGRTPDIWSRMLLVLGRRKFSIEIIPEAMSYSFILMEQVSMYKNQPYRFCQVGHWVTQRAGQLEQSTSTGRVEETWSSSDPLRSSLMSTSRRNKINYSLYHGFSDYEVFLIILGILLEALLEIGCSALLVVREGPYIKLQLRARHLWTRRKPQELSPGEWWSPKGLYKTLRPQSLPT